MTKAELLRLLEPYADGETVNLRAVIDPPDQDCEVGKINPATLSYSEERYCTHCRKETTHRCIDSGHERDSSGDRQECAECGWYVIGQGDANPPLQEKHL